MLNDREEKTIPSRLLRKVKIKGVIMSYMSELDLSIRELIFDGTLEENIKENVGKKIKIKDHTHVVSEKEVRDYYYWYREDE